MVAVFFLISVFCCVVGVGKGLWVPNAHLWADLFSTYFTQASRHLDAQESKVVCNYMSFRFRVGRGQPQLRNSRCWRPFWQRFRDVDSRVPDSQDHFPNCVKGKNDEISTGKVAFLDLYQNDAPKAGEPMSHQGSSGIIRAGGKIGHFTSLIRGW